MEIKYSDGVEFEVEDVASARKEPAVTLEKESDLQKIIRQGFRAPVVPAQHMGLSIEGVAYEIYNLSAKGMGIYLHDAESLEMHTELSGMHFTIEDHTFTVDGKVVHRASDGVNNLCGIELTRMSPECQKEIAAFLRKSRNSLFAA